MKKEDKLKNMEVPESVLPSAYLLLKGYSPPYVNEDGKVINLSISLDGSANQLYSLFHALLTQYPRIRPIIEDALSETQ